MTRLFVIGAVVALVFHEWRAFGMFALAALLLAVWNGAREGWREMMEQHRAAERRRRRY